MPIPQEGSNSTILQVNYGGCFKSLVQSYTAVGWGYNTRPVGLGSDSQDTSKVCCESKIQKGGGYMHVGQRYRGVKVGKSQEDPQTCR